MKLTARSKMRRDHARNKANRGVDKLLARLHKEGERLSDPRIINQKRKRQKHGNT
jgi:hypothetical protein